MSQYRSTRQMGFVAPRAAPPPSRRRHTTIARLIGALGLVTLTALLYWLLTDDSFRVTDADVRFEGLRHADEAEVRARLTDLDRGPNVFRVRATDIVAELSTLTEVDAAVATVTLPAGVVVHLDEREPLFVWSDGERSWMVDEEGMLFAPADVVEGETTDTGAADDNAEAEIAGADAAGPETGEPADPENIETVTDSAERAARAALPVVEDERLRDVAPIEGMYLPHADLVVMRQLLALTPELLGSRSESLHLRVDEDDGYVLESEDRAWSAQFGHYTPSLQPPEVVPRQVQCLSWLLASKENVLDEVRLALSEGACGTFTKIDEKPARSG